MRSDCGGPEGQGTFGSDLPPGAFHVSVEDPDTRSGVFELAVCCGALLTPAPSRLPKEHLRMGAVCTLVQAGPPVCEFSFGAYPPQSSLDSTGHCTPWGVQGGCQRVVKGLLPEETLCQDGSI